MRDGRSVVGIWRCDHQGVIPRACSAACSPGTRLLPSQGSRLVWGHGVRPGLLFSGGSQPRTNQGNSQPGSSPPVHDVGSRVSGQGRDKQPGLLTWDGRPVTQRNSSSAHLPLLFPAVRPLPCPAASMMPCVLTDRVRRWRLHRELLTLQPLVCGGVRAGLPAGRFHESGRGKGTVLGTKGDV